MKRTITLTASIAWVMLMIPWSQAADQPDPYCEYKPDESPAQWCGLKGVGPEAPEVSVAEDACVGNTAVEARVVAGGNYQGIILNLSDPIDLNEYKRVHFWIKNGFYHGMADCVLRIEFARGKPSYCTFKAGAGQWTEVDIPLDPDQWNNLEGDKSKLRLDVAERLVWYPYGAMSQSRQYIMLDGVCFSK